MKELLTTTEKANRLINEGKTKMQLSEDLGISRPTLNSRLDKITNWKKLEVNFISRMYKEL